MMIADSDIILGIEAWKWKLTVLPAVLVLLTVMSVGKLVLPRIEEATALKVKLAGVNKNIKLLEDKTRYLERVDAEELNKNMESLEMAMLKGRDAYFLVNVIRQVAGKYGFRVESFIVSPGVVEEEGGEEGKSENSGLLRVPVEVVVKGPAEKYREFVAGLEKSLPIMTIGEMEMETTGGLSELKLGVYTFFSTEGTEVKIAGLGLADLVLTEAEEKAVEKISTYSKIEGLSLEEKGLIKKKEFTEYQREDPFSL